MTSMLTGGNTSLGGHNKTIGTSRNQALIAPAGTKNKVGGATANNHIQTALVNLAASSSMGASIDDIAGAGGMSNSQNLNRTLGSTSGGVGNRYF